MLDDILRTSWNFSGVVVSDEGAVEFIATQHHFTATLAGAAAVSINAGCDMDMANGGGAFRQLENASNVTDARIDEALGRILTSRFQVGALDPPEVVQYSSIPYSVIGSEQHRALALKSAESGMVLLQNLNDTLPLGRSLKKLAVIGVRTSRVSSIIIV